MCDGCSAADRAKWCMDNMDLSKHAARDKVMHEFLEHFRVWVDPSLTWKPDVICRGLSAEDRADWCVENRGWSDERARQQVMHEFPHLFTPQGRREANEECRRQCTPTERSAKRYHGHAWWEFVWPFLLDFDTQDPLDEKRILRRYWQEIKQGQSPDCGSSQHAHRLPGFVPEEAESPYEFDRSIFVELSQASRDVHRSFKSSKGWLAIAEWQYPRRMRFALLRIALVLCWFHKYGLRYWYPATRRFVPLEEPCLDMQIYLRQARDKLLQHKEHCSAMLEPDLWPLRIAETWWRPALEACLDLFEGVKMCMHRETVQHFEDFLSTFFPGQRSSLNITWSVRDDVEEESEGAKGSGKNHGMRRHVERHRKGKGKGRRPGGEALQTEEFQNDGVFSGDEQDDVLHDEVSSAEREHARLLIEQEFFDEVRLLSEQE